MCNYIKGYYLIVFLLMSLQSLRAQVKLYQNALKAKQAMRFFKTGVGEYAEGDKFVGLSNPQCRQIAAAHKNINIVSIETLLNSEVHEERFIALVIMDHQFKIKNNSETIYKLLVFIQKSLQRHLNNLKGINNWDLVDLSAPNIVGKYLLSKCQQFDAIVSKDDPRNILYEWAVSNSLWERRISIVSTFSLIRANYFYDTLRISKILLNDKHDLIHKAVGWMLRQVGKRNEVIQEKFIKDNYNNIPRTALRYAIQKFLEGKRKQYLKGQF